MEDKAKDEQMQELVSTSLQISSPTSVLAKFVLEHRRYKHMTPHRHWLHNYEAHSIPIRLTNNESILYWQRGCPIQT